MRAHLYVAAFLLALLGSFAPAAAASTSLQAKLIGTWQWAALDGKPVTQTFYMRFYSDGISASWPAPKNWPTTVKGVSRGRYHLEGDVLVDETGRGKDDPKSHLKFSGDNFVLSGQMHGALHRLTYRRVMPALEPGKFRTGDHRLRFAPHPPYYRSG